MAKILRDAGLSELVESPELECLARGFEFTEGPLGCPDGSILFQDNKAEKTYRIAADRSVQLVRDQTGAANGQTFGPDGRILFCEQNGRRVSPPSLTASKPASNPAERDTQAPFLESHRWNPTHAQRPHKPYRRA